jgi:UDP:flavonoid glycosyltransferase YjiC (YdhE family)
MKSLAAGRPLLILPHGRDQADNAMRVAARGAGLTLDRTSDAAAIRAALRRLLDEPAFTTHARALGAPIARDAANTPITALLERFAEADAPPLAAAAR